MKKINFLSGGGQNDSRLEKLDMIMTDWTPTPASKFWGKLENKVDGSVTLSQGNLRLDVQKVWGNVSMDLLGK